MLTNENAEKLRMTFYPMAGGVSEQFGNLLSTLDWIFTAKPTPNEVREWLRNKFVLTEYFARDVYTVLLISTGLVKVVGENCRLTTDGLSVVSTRSSVVLLEIFEKSFAGVAAFLEVLRSKPKIRKEALVGIWFEIVKDRFPRMQNWSRRTLLNQCKHRIDWLRTMGFIDYINGLYSLSENGWSFVQKNPPEAIAIQKHEIKVEERELREMLVESFEPFSRSGEKTVTLRRAYARDRAFRIVVTAQYGYFCAICGFSIQTPRGNHESEAAHIVPKRRLGTDDPRNGICLCSTCHWLFDEGVLSILADRLSVEVATFVASRKTDFSIRRVLSYKGKSIRPVKNSIYSPANEALLWHNENIFLG